MSTNIETFVFVKDERTGFGLLFFSFQILGTFLAYIIICMQFAQSNSNPEIKCNCYPYQAYVPPDFKTNLSSLNISNISNVDNTF